MTWRDYFPESKLFTLDLVLNRMDAAWPLVPSVENGIKTLEHLLRHKRELEFKLVFVSHYLSQLDEDTVEPPIKKMKINGTVDSDASKTDNLSNPAALHEVDVTISGVDSPTSGSKVQCSAEINSEGEDDDVIAIIEPVEDPIEIEDEDEVDVSNDIVSPPPPSSSSSSSSSSMSKDIVTLDYPIKIKEEKMDSSFEDVGEFSDEIVAEPIYGECNN